MELERIRSAIAAEGADAWIMVDYENGNATVASLLGHVMLTRKIFLIVPANGKPYLIAHQIDEGCLLPETKQSFNVHVYRTWQEMLELECNLFSSYRNVLMDISEYGLLPRVSLADYGSVEFVKSLGVDVLSSANVLQHLSAVMDEKALQFQVEACKTCLKIKDEAFALIAEQVRKTGQSDEYAIQQFITNRFDEEGMTYDEAPIVATQRNSWNPHYAPSASSHDTIREGDLVLIDMWAKFRFPGAIYADITWMGYVGETIPEDIAKLFAIVASGRDAAIAFLEENVPLRNVCGYEADDAARQEITRHGYGEYFSHRLGHSIYSDDSPHGPGANLDNLESHDTRHLIEKTSFSVEPGIYIPRRIGLRSETDLQVVDGKIRVVGGLQKEVIPILAR